MNTVLAGIGLLIVTSIDFENITFYAVLTVILYVLLIIERRSRRNECSKLWKEVHRGN